MAKISVKSTSANDFDDLTKQADQDVDNPGNDPLSDDQDQDAQPGQVDDEPSPPEYEQKLRDVLGDETVDSYKTVLGKKRLDFTPENIAKVPDILQEQDKTITKLFQESKDQGTFQDISGPRQPYQQQTGQDGQVDPFLVGFAQDPQGTLERTLMGTLGKIANVNQQKQQAAMELEDRMLESHPHAAAIMPTYNRLIARGIDPESAWNKAEVSFWRSQNAGIMTRMGKNRRRADAVHVEGSGGASDVMDTGMPGDFDSADDLRKYILKKGAYKDQSL